MKTVPITYTVGGPKGRTPKKELIMRSWKQPQSEFEPALKLIQTHCKTR